MNGPHGEINQIREFAYSGQLFNCSDENRLTRMVAVISHYDASGNSHMADGVRDAVKAQLARVQSERHHTKEIAEMRRLNAEQMDESKRMFAESAIDSDKKHIQSLSTANLANALSKKAIRVAWLSFWAAIIIGIIAVIVAHLDSTRPSTAGTSAIPAKTPPQPLETPQIVSSTPLPSSTNAIPKKQFSKSSPVFSATFENHSNSRRNSLMAIQAKIAKRFLKFLAKKVDGLSAPGRNLVSNQDTAAALILLLQAA